jgi:DNA-binding CsgD family transcriptional regulator
MDFFGAPTPGAPRRAFPQLTEREEEVLSLIAQGESNQEIAKALFLSVKTVLNHASNIFMKLQVADRAQAVIRAREAGMGREGGPESGGHALKAGRGPRSMAGTHGASRQGDASSIAT